MAFDVTQGEFLRVSMDFSERFPGVVVTHVTQVSPRGRVAFWTARFARNRVSYVRRRGGKLLECQGKTPAALARAVGFAIRRRPELAHLRADFFRAAARRR